MLQLEMISSHDHVAVLLHMLAVQQLLWQVFTDAVGKLCRKVMVDCRVFVAQRESYEDTWINNYSPFVSEYAADASASLLTSQEVCCTIELQVLAGESVQCMTLHTDIDAVTPHKPLCHMMHVPFSMNLYATWCQTFQTGIVRCFVAVYYQETDHLGSRPGLYFLAQSTCVV